MQVDLTALGTITSELTSIRKLTRARLEDIGVDVSGAGAVSSS
jgi:hypothetical protein